MALVLSNTHLSDGTGFGLLVALASLPIPAFFCLSVENSCFWLPAMVEKNAGDGQLSDLRRLRAHWKKRPGV